MFCFSQDFNFLVEGTWNKKKIKHCLEFIGFDKQYLSSTLGFCVIKSHHNTDEQ